jgi:hypothetical protein
MTSTTNLRRLAFERLERKTLPSTLLLLFAPLDDDAHNGAEQAGLFDETSGIRTVAAQWRFEHEASELLRFVEQHTRHTRAGMHDRPTAGQCLAVDAMMQLKDATLRSMVASDEGTAAVLTAVRPET